MHKIASVKNLRFPRVQALTRDATNSDLISFSVKNQIARLSFNEDAAITILEVLFTTVTNINSWKHVRNSLLLLTFLALNGGRKVLEAIKQNNNEIQKLGNFKFEDYLGDHTHLVRTELGVLDQALLEIGFIDSKTVPYDCFKDIPVDINMEEIQMIDGPAPPSTMQGLYPSNSISGDNINHENLLKVPSKHAQTIKDEYYEPLDVINENVEIKNIEEGLFKSLELISDIDHAAIYSNLKNMALKSSSCLPNQSLAGEKELIETEPNESLAEEKELIETEPNESLAGEKELIETEPNGSLAGEKELIESEPNKSLTKEKELIETEPNESMANKKESTQTEPNASLADKQELIETYPSISLAEVKELLETVDSSDIFEVEIGPDSRTKIQREYKSQDLNFLTDIKAVTDLLQQKYSILLSVHKNRDIQSLEIFIAESREMQYLGLHIIKFWTPFAKTQCSDILIRGRILEGLIKLECLCRQLKSTGNQFQLAVNDIDPNRMYAFQADTGQVLSCASNVVTCAVEIILKNCEAAKISCRLD
jgi:hypothetical protein